MANLGACFKQGGLKHKSHARPLASKHFNPLCTSSCQSQSNLSVCVKCLMPTNFPLEIFLSRFKLASTFSLFKFVQPIMPRIKLSVLESSIMSSLFI